MIRHVGSKWVLYTKDGTKVLGKYATKQQAQKRERQVIWFKNHPKK
jgi:hypothetical protein